VRAIESLSFTTTPAIRWRFAVVITRVLRKLTAKPSAHAIAAIVPTTCVAERTRWRSPEITRSSA
jgi:hypothetical protein